MVIEGCVRDAALRPVRGCMVIIVSSPTDHAETAAISDEHGRFVFSAVVHGRYRLAAMFDERCAVEREVEVAGDEITRMDLVLSDLAT